MRYELIKLLAETETDSSTEQLKKIFKSPILYIVLGAIVLLIIAIYLIRRIVKGKPKTIVVVTRKGKIYKLIDENTNKYFLVPFVDSVGARISLDNQSFQTDKLFINDGPDHLYKINFSFEYKVTNPENYFYNLNNLQNVLETKINDVLREFADNGNAEILIKDYKKNNEKIISLLNMASEDMGIEILSFKINFIQPMNGN